MSNSEDKKVIRDFKITSLALKNKNTVYVLTAIIIFFGIYSYIKLPKELFPEITWPQIMVQTLYLGNAPEDIENLITRPLEKEIENVRGIKELSSISAQDASMIFVEFNTDVDLEDALRRVKDAVDKAESEIPQNDEDLIGPSTFDIDLSEFPILSINISGSYSVEELRAYAEDLQDKMEEIGEVSKVLIEGINEREVKVNADLVKLEAYNMTFFQLMDAIQKENLSVSGGEILMGNIRRGIRVIGEFENVDQLRNIIVKREKGNIVYLKDVAEVKFGYAEAKSFARLDKQPVVSIQVVKKGGENLLSTTASIYDVLEEAKETKLLPDDINVSITNDQSEMVEMQLQNLENSIIMGVIFVVLVLFFFLGTRNALFVGLAIPMSMLLSFVIIGAIDYRINMIVLFALILALGMLVDNGIVVVENIYRYLDRGYKPFQAAKQAVGEIAVPIIASTMTTLAAFLPLAFWHGIMGEFMKYLPITLIIVLSSSLFVALVIIPVIASDFAKTNSNNKFDSKRKRNRAKLVAVALIVVGLLLVLASVNILGNLLIVFGIIGVLNLMVLHRMESWFQEVFLVKLESVYEKALRFALKGKNLLLFFFGTVGLLIFTLVFFGMRMPNITLFPDSDPNYINIVSELPSGTDILATNEFVKELEEDIFDIIQPYDTIVESVLTTVGKGDPMDFSSGPQVNKALITISFIDYELRGDYSSSELMKMLTDKLVGNYPGVEMEITKDEGGPPTGKPVNLEIIGQDFDQLVHLSDSIKTYLNNQNIEGLEGLKMDISTQKPEILVHVNRDKARRFGLSTNDIASTLRTALLGMNISDYKVGEDEYPIQIRLKDEYRYNLAALKNLKVTLFGGDDGPVNVPISAVADFEYSTTFSSVRRKDMERVITLYSNVVEGYNANSINERLKSYMEKFEMPGGYKYAFTGEQEEQNESSEFLINALLLAVALIFLILVTQFNSVIRPFIILISILLSTIGVFGGIATFRMDFIIIMTGIGIISLAGIVVNNAIVLIDYIDLLKQRKRKELGMPNDQELSIAEATSCIIEGGKTRLRPVLLTAITTILGLFPMAIGINIDFKGLLENYDPNIYFGGDMAAMWSPMSWTVIFGLTFSTFLTLIIVPVMYRMSTIGQNKLKGLFSDYKERIANNNK